MASFDDQSVLVRFVEFGDDEQRTRAVDAQKVHLEGQEVCIEELEVLLRELVSICSPEDWLRWSSDTPMTKPDGMTGCRSFDAVEFEVDERMARLISIDAGYYSLGLLSAGQFLEHLSAIRGNA